MKIPTEDDCGNQPRDYVIGRLRDFNIEVLASDDSDWFEIIDRAGDVEVIFLADPVSARMVIHLWRRFGHMEGMLITDFVEGSTVH